MAAVGDAFHLFNLHSELYYNPAFMRLQALRVLPGAPRMECAERHTVPSEKIGYHSRFL